MLSTIHKRLHTRLAHRLFLQAQKELADIRPRWTLALLLGLVFAIVIISMSYLILIGGAALIALNPTVISAWVFGLIMMLFGYVLVPKRPRNLQKTYRRSELPKLFALLDTIAQAVGTTAPDGVHLSASMSAYMTQFRRGFRRQEEWVLGIGLPLGTAMQPDQRLAVLGHELAHRVNGDPLRQGIFADAKQVLESWYSTVGPDVYETGEVSYGDSLAEILVRSIMSFFLRGLYALLVRLSFWESQRSEYRADADACRVAGNQPLISCLELLSRAPIADRAHLEMFPYTEPHNGRIFDHLPAP